MSQWVSESVTGVGIELSQTLVWTAKNTLPHPSCRPSPCSRIQVWLEKTPAVWEVSMEEKIFHSRFHFLPSHPTSSHLTCWRYCVKIWIRMSRWTWLWMGVASNNNALLSSNSNSWKTSVCLKMSNCSVSVYSAYILWILKETFRLKNSLLLSCTNIQPI